MSLAGAIALAYLALVAGAVLGWVTFMLGIDREEG